MLRLAVLIFPLLSPGLAAASELNPCRDAGGQQSMNICIGKKVDEADAVLNRLYGQLGGKLDPNGKRNLVAAERAWVLFRDKECALRSGLDSERGENNGTITPLLVGECQLDLTNRRIADLSEQLKCPGGDLSCEP